MAPSTTRTENLEANQNWTECEACGAKLLVDPDSQTPERCTECESKSMKIPLLGGSIILVIIAVAILVAMLFGVYLLQVQLS